MLEQVAVARVRLLRRGIAGVLAHRPQALAIHVGVNPARVSELARRLGLERLLWRRIRRRDLDPRVGEAAAVAGANDRRDRQIAVRAIGAAGHRDSRILAARSRESERAAVDAYVLAASWNWTSSVEPRSASVELVPALIASITASK